MFRPPRVELALLPTPLHRLNRVSADWKTEVWIKRDDLTGLAFGGNKARKLEYLVAEAIDRGADTVVTCGSLQSNFVRQLGAACSMYGLACHAVVMELPFDSTRPNESAGNPGSGNALLDRWLGVHLHLVPDGTWDALDDHLKELACDLERAGHKVYSIPVGGSTLLGAWAFYLAGEELASQKPDFRTVVTASSSGSTQVGLSYAFADKDVEVVGILCDPEPDIGKDFANLGSQLASALDGGGVIAAEDFRVVSDFVGPGYGVTSEPGQNAIRYLARSEGIFLDPVYSGKAFAGLKALVQAGELKPPIVFWHTGGTPALFAFP